MATPIDRDALLQIVAGTAARTGGEFFDHLVKHVAGALGTRCAWVTEWLPQEGRLRALSFWDGGDYVTGYEYAVAGTPCEPVISGCSTVHIPERVIELYPDDPDLAPVAAVSYMGIPLVDTDGAILGHLAVMHDDPLPASEQVTAIFEIFAARAAAELRRVRRDRDLREREEKLSLLIDSAMDAIVELDAELQITRINPAAAQTFAVDAVAAVGRQFGSFLSAESRGRLLYLRQELRRRTPARRSLAIPDGLDAQRADGAPFKAEATMSGFEVRGEPFFTLILRDVHARLDAEDRIRELLRETDRLRAEIGALQGFEEILGSSAALRSVLQDVAKVAGTDATVLITGETGTGKELIASAVHRRSARAGRPLVRVNCAAIAANLQESEFFGHVKGAFTGATANRQGRFELADGGTIFLDEVGELPLDLQVKLLRVLQEGEFEPVGSGRTLQVDVRVIAATNRDLDAMVRDGSFRADLLYRLNVFPIAVPPLRERGDDVLLLAEAFARDLDRQSSSTMAPLSAACRSRLLAYDWPGNIRELQNVIERAFITSEDGRRLNLDRALPDRRTAAAPPPVAVADERIYTVLEMQELERANIERALARTGFKISGRGGAAEMLGINPNTLASRMKSLGIRRPERT